MLETVSRGFKAARDRFLGTSVDPNAIAEAMRDIRLALLEADVELGVVKRFLARVKQRAEAEITGASAVFVHEGKTEKVTAYHQFVAICQEELESLMGSVPSALNLAPMGVTAIMMVGLQGSGKTTTSAKLARYLQEREGKRPLLVAADLQRPAAIDQLERLGEQIEVPVHSQRGGDALVLCAEALANARDKRRDVVIFDTAGRLAVDEVLMAELSRIKARTQPQEVLLVIDAMIGQDAVRTAEAFHAQLGITGVVMTKLDGDARGGAALSIREVTGQPIKFLGMGEGTSEIEVFRPEGLASRILGMGDMVGLVREFERHVDSDRVEVEAERMFRGQFDMSDFVEQIEVLKKMGSLGALLDRMPISAEAMGGLRPDDRELMKIIAVHHSMTPLERRRPALVRDPGRLKRVGLGSGLGERKVIDVLNKFDVMRRMMIAVGEEPSMLERLPGIGQLAKVRKLRGQDLSELFGDLYEPEAEAAEIDEAPEPEVQPAKREYFANLGDPKRPKKPKAKSKAQVKNKRKQAKQARKQKRR